MRRAPHSCGDFAWSLSKGLKRQIESLPLRFILSECQATQGEPKFAVFCATIALTCERKRLGFSAWNYSSRVSDWAGWGCGELLYC